MKQTVKKEEHESDRWALREHQPPLRVYTLCKSALRLGVTSSMTGIFFLSVQLHPRQYEVFSICLTSLLKYQAMLQSQPKPNATDGFVAVRKNRLRQKVSLSNHSLSNLFKQPQFSSKHIITGGGEKGGRLR